MTAITIQDKPNIPAEMLEERRWVAWRYELRDGKQTKVPIDPETGGYASSTDPQTWSTYEYALERWAKSGLAGVGFVLGDGWVGIDFDKYRDKESGHLFEPVPSVVERLGTYAEVSPSKTGVKIIGRGKLPEGYKNRTGKDKITGREIEVYDSGRYFTVTGEKLPEAPTTVRDVSQELEAFCREHLPKRNTAASCGPKSVDAPVGVPGSALTDREIESILLSRNGERGDELRQMWGGGIPSRFGGDDNRADESLVNTLVYYTGGDLEQADRLFRRSGLMRDKWERADYRMKTFTLAMSGRGPDDFYTRNGNLESLLPPLEELALGFATRSPIHEYMRKGIEDPPILIDGLLYAGTKYPDGHTEGAVHTWYGEPGCGKSMVALWASIEVMRKGENVVYIDEEGTKRMITERLTGLGATPEEIEGRFFYYNSPYLTTDKAHLKQLMNIAETLHPSLVVFDSWIDFLANDGRNENSSDEVIGWAMAVSKAFVNVGASVVLLDHVTKDGNGRGARGSGGKLGWVMVGHKVTVKMPFDRHSMGGVAFIRQKDREGALPASVTFAIGGDGTGDIFCLPNTRDAFTIPDDDGLTPSARKALDALPLGGLGYTEWWRASGIGSKATLTKAAKALTNGGFVRQEGTLYIPVTSGTPGTVHP